MRARILGIILAAVLAVGGAVVLTGYVASADSRAIATTKPVAVYAVKRTIPAGTAADAILPYLEVKQMPQVAAVPGRVEDLGALKGLLTNSVIQPGEQLLKARFSTAAAIEAASGPRLPEGTQAVTVQLPLEQAVGGDLKAGDVVGVVIALKQSAKESLNKIVVLDVTPGQTLVSKDSQEQQTNVSTVRVTLALKDGEVADVVTGQNFGKVWLAKQSKPVGATTTAGADS